MSAIICELRDLQDHLTQVAATLAEEIHAKLTTAFFRAAKLGEKPRRTWQEAVLRWAEEKAHKASFADDLKHLAVLDLLLRDKYLDEIGLDLTCWRNYRRILPTWPPSPWRPACARPT